MELFSFWTLSPCHNLSLISIDNRIVKYRLPTVSLLHMQKCHLFQKEKKCGGHFEDGLLLGGGIRDS